MVTWCNLNPACHRESPSLTMMAPGMNWFLWLVLLSCCVYLNQSVILDNKDNDKCSDVTFV